jgi:hypothetical protein
MNGRSAPPASAALIQELHKIVEKLLRGPTRRGRGTLDLNKLRGADRLTILWLTRTQRASTNGARIGGSPSDAGARPPAPAG